MTMTRNAAATLNRYRIRVNQINVGWTLTEVFAFASDVEADQTAEIDRMGAMLNTLMKEHQR